jgi:putative transposon-encoded protein
MKRKPIQMKMEGYEVVEKTAKYSGNGAQIYVPKHWGNKKIKVVLVE